MKSFIWESISTVSESCTTHPSRCDKSGWGTAVWLPSVCDIRETKIGLGTYVCQQPGEKCKSMQTKLARWGQGKEIGVGGWDGDEAIGELVCTRGGHRLYPCSDPTVTAETAEACVFIPDFLRVSHIYTCPPACFLRCLPISNTSGTELSSCPLSLSSSGVSTPRLLFTSYRQVPKHRFPGIPLFH